MAIDSNLQSNISVDLTAFNLEPNAHMFKMLFKNIYNNVILAPIRELACNAYDACIESNLPVNFDVHLPTIQEPHFSVRDYGSGMSEETINTLYSTMGASSKRTSNDVVGCFGIGKLSPLAYTTSFTLNSYHNGTHSSYLISIKDGIPGFLKLSEVPTQEAQGVEVSFAVKAQDIPDFKKEAEQLFQFFDHRPNTNIELTYKKPALEGSFWEYYNNFNSWCGYVVMGNICYKEDRHLNNGLVIRVPIGSLSITPGRESLVYDEATTKFLQAKNQEAKEEMQANAISTIQAKPTIYEQLLAFRAATRTCNIKPSDISTDFQNYITYTAFKAEQSDFYITSIGTWDARATKVSSYHPPESTTPIVLIQDTSKGYIQLAHKALKDNDITSALIVRPNSPSLTSIDKMLEAYEDYFEAIGLKPTYIKLSTFVEEKTRTVSTKLADTEFRPKYINKWGTGTHSSNLTTSDTAYYMTELDESIHPALALLDLTVYIPPKRALKAVQESPTFTLFTKEIMIFLLSQKKYETYGPNYSTFYSSSLPLSSLKNIESRLPIKEAVKIFKSTSRFVSSSEKKFLTSLNIPITTIETPCTAGKIEKTYPLLKELKYNTEEVIQHYISLEDHYALHSNSGLNSPSNSDTTNDS